MQLSWAVRLQRRSARSCSCLLGLWRELSLRRHHQLKRHVQYKHQSALFSLCTFARGFFAVLLVAPRTVPPRLNDSLVSWHCPAGASSLLDNEDIQNDASFSFCIFRTRTRVLLVAGPSCRLLLLLAELPQDSSKCYKNKTGQT